MAFFDGLLSKLARMWPTFLSGIVKRLLEYVYDKGFESPLGRYLVAMSTSKKHTVEIFLNLLNALFDDQLAGNAGLKKFLNEIVIDAAPEVSKRMFNGVREEILASAKTDIEKDLVQFLLGLEDKELFGLLNWFAEKSISERATISSYLSLMSAEQIVRLMNFSVEDRERFFGIIDPRTRPKEGRGVLGMMADDINNLSDRFEKKETRQ